MSKKHSNYKVTNKLRFITTVCLLSLFLSMTFFTVLVNAKEDKPVNLIPVYVEQGDTLWHLSSQYVGDNMDIRDYISMVMEVNDLSSATIQPGKLLYFPNNK